MKFLFFDCETTGITKDYKASYEDVDNWPRVISLAWILADSSGNILHQQHELIKPNGWQMPTEPFWIDNGFTHEKNMAEGKPIEEVLEAFINSKSQADTLVAHNISFDHRVIWAEIIRAGKEPKRGMEKICTMMKSTKYCNLPNPKGKGPAKWPKLAELYRHLFECDFDGAHDALADVQACMKCFFELVSKKVIEVFEPAIEPIEEPLPFE